MRKHNNLKFLFVFFGDCFVKVRIRRIVLFPVKKINFNLFFAPVDDPVLRDAHFTVYLHLLISVIQLGGIRQYFHNKTGNTSKRYIFSVTHITDDRYVRYHGSVVIFTPLILNTVAKYAAQTVLDLISYFDNKIMDDHGMFKICFAHVFYG